MRAAVVGANTKIADLATFAIHLRWPEVTPIVVTSAAVALDMISRESLDVMLLRPDIGDSTLAEFIRDMRGLTHVPPLVLSDQGDETKVVTALEAGADDYVRLPCDLTEIMIRIWALVRRAEHPVIPSLLKGCMKVWGDSVVAHGRARPPCPKPTLFIQNWYKFR